MTEMNMAYNKIELKRKIIGKVKAVEDMKVLLMTYGFVSDGPEEIEGGIDDNGYVYCPKCHGKTEKKVTEDTVLRDFPLYCSKCREETIVSVARGFRLIV